MRSVDDTRFTARVHWAPPFIPASAIAEAMGEKCIVNAGEYEMFKVKGLENFPTSIRLVTMVGDRHAVPHLITVTNPINNQKFEMLVTVAGRAPLCLKCRQTGHYRRDCSTPHCRQKPQFLSELFKTNCVDICFLQETHCYSKFIANLGEAMGWEMFLVIWK